MSQLNNNDNLESFFQKLSHKPGIEFMENDWMNMEELLNKEKAKRIFLPWIFWKYTGVFLAFLLLSGGAYLYYVNNINDNKRGLTVSAPKNETLNEPASQPEKTNKALNEEFSNTETKPIDDFNQKAISKNITEPQLTVRQNKVSVEIASLNNIVTNKKSIPFAFEKNQSVNNKANNYQEKRDSELIYSNTIVSSQVHLFHPKQSTSLLLLLPNEIVHKEIVIKDTVQSREEANKANNILHPANNVSKKSGPAISKWSVAAYAGPEVSHTKTYKLGTLSSSFSLSAFYNISKRVFLSSGVSYSSKKFSGKGVDSKPPGGFWIANTNAVIPDVITAKSNYLDIPLLAGYKIAGWRKSNISIIAGLSNYVITSEYYRFSFKTPNPGAKENWESHKTTFQPLSAANISISYSLDVRPGVSLEAAPYIKLPVRNSGWANYEITSSGISLGMKYKIPPKKRAPPGN